MWMASGFIRQKFHGEERLEDIGEEYFNYLFKKSFFERHPRLYGLYIMHDLMHDLARNVSKEECCRLEPNDKSDNIPITAQHVFVPESKIERIFNLRNLHTLIITLYMSQDDIKFVPPIGSLKETLRVLVIEGTCVRRCELPKEIDSLLHLRFLKINVLSMGSDRYFLPNSINKLYHLQVLDMSDSMEKRFHRIYFPYLDSAKTTGITNLVSLRYMNLPYEMMQKIQGVHKLTSLQELDFFVGRKRGHHIDELHVLNNLRRLSIHHLENVGNPIEAMNTNLSEKKNLISLSLHWTEESNSSDPVQVIDNLQPSPNLKELAINYYKGHRSPNWMRDSSYLTYHSSYFKSVIFEKHYIFLGKCHI